MTDKVAKQIAGSKAYDCDILRFEHESKALGNLPAKFHMIIPPSVDQKPGLLVWLSGLTCTDENFAIKAGAAQYANAYNIAIACPDTSPRGANAPNEDDSYDFGAGAGFYVDATEKGYENYQMETYITTEFISVLRSQFADRLNMERIGVSGHSMGGMGALCLAMRHRNLFYSVSAFAPIANPTQSPWGHKCFGGYLGNDKQIWNEHDPTEIMKKQGPIFKNILIHQGTDDQYMDHLLPDQFVEACKSVGQKVRNMFYRSPSCYGRSRTAISRREPKYFSDFFFNAAQSDIILLLTPLKLDMNMAGGYDHSYFFVQTFLENHVRYHAETIGVWKP